MSDNNFSAKAQEVIDLIQNTNKNLFITGKAGTGKSTLLKHISNIDPSTIVIAPTGIAAINVNGDTIHSFFKLKPGYELDEAKNVKVNKNMISTYASVHTVIIDEISMVRADIIDAINFFLQRVKGNQDYFGGVRMIFFGDLFQLPPVLRNEDKAKFLTNYSSPYFFSASIFDQKDLFTPPFEIKTCELTTIYRQKDNHFTDILNAIRINQVTPAHLTKLNQQVNSTDNSNGPIEIELVATNAIASRVNKHRLTTIKLPEIKFTATQTGAIQNLRPNDLEITVKIGAQVMFINNDSDKKWVNGSIGKIIKKDTKLDKETNIPYVFLEVELENKKKVKVTQHTWPISRYVFKGGRFTRDEIGTFTQVPLKLAWAITIHKSQGKTFDKIKIDLGSGSFAHGQTYVALSRCRTLENINLVKPITKSDIIVDELVFDYYKETTSKN
jgi:ATP-dependent exoDNAse (exonuclease V) alpha subunit